MYASIFDYPISAAELARSLPRHKASAEGVRHAIAVRPFLRRRIERVGEWYVPAGRRDLVEIRRRREASSRAFLLAQRRMLDGICAMPFTRLVAISGSLAHLNADDRADLDLFIVTRGNRVWTVALGLVVLSRLMGRRKLVCANFLLADSNLALDQRDLYTANQVLHLRPVIGEETLGRFIAANKPLLEWFPNAADEPPAPFPLPPAGPVRRVKRVLELLFWAPSGVVEGVCRRVYGWHLRRKVSSWRSPEEVQLEPWCLKLHTNSHRAAVLERLEQLVAESAAPVTIDRRPGGAC